MYQYKNLLVKVLIAGLLASSLFILQFVPAFAGQDAQNLAKREKTELLVKYRNETKVETVKNNIKSKLKLSRFNTKKKLRRQKIEVLEVDDKDDVKKVAEELKKDPDVEYAQPNYKLSISSIDDPRFSEQWGLQNNGPTQEGQTGRSGVDINAVNAWNITTGSPSVLVGVLDTGIDITHEDLKDNIYVNPSETAGDGIDNDGNGYVDDVNGWDFANGDNNVKNESALDVHGTQIAGIIAAEANSLGIRGVAPHVKILPLKFISGGSGYTSDAIDAIAYAQQMGVKIINCSFGSTNENPALKDAMANSGILFVCAAGNGGADVSVTPIYPANSSLPNILSVAAIDSNGMLLATSSYGNTVQVAAPGEKILSTIPGNGYDSITGTSASAPCVTGVAALLLSQNPGMTASDIIARINKNVTPCTSLTGKVSSGGRVNAYAALANMPPQADTTPPEQNNNGGQTTNPYGESTDDTLYTMDLANLIQEKIHYGESGVNAATGSFSISNKDMSIPSPGFSIDISRTYNSKDDRTNGPMGMGWTFGFEGSAIDYYGYKKVTLPDGKVQMFKIETNGSYTAQDSRSKFVRTAEDGSTWILTTKDQYRYGFNSGGWLIWMKDRNGNKVTIDVSSTGKVNGITDATGRHFTIAYNSYGFIGTITDDAAQRSVSYTYDASSKRLIKVTDPAGNTMNYHYDSMGYLDTVIDPYSKNLLSITYNHAAGNDQNKVSKVTDTFGNTYTYVYDSTNKKTTITDS